MPIVTFWSNSKKTIGQTVSAATTATVLAMEHNYKILLISADINNMKMEECFGAQQSNKDIIKNIVSGPRVNLETGTNGLLKLAQSNRVTPEIIKDYTKIVYKNRLEILYSSTSTEVPKEEQLECFKTIILNASKYYDYVLVDLKKGTGNAKVEEILNISDIIVLNTEQGIKTLEEFFKMPETQKYIKSGKVIWNIGKYDKNSKYNIKNLTRTIWNRQPIYNIPYSTLLFEATNEGTLAEVLLRIRTIKTEDDTLDILKSGKELSEGILLKYQELRMRM